MGLGTHSSRARDGVTLTAEEEAAFAALDLPLREWVGTGCFRGKVYIDVTHDVARVNLGEEWILPQDVAHLAEAFAACDPQ